MKEPMSASSSSWPARSALSAYYLLLYNGKNQDIYASNTLSGVIADLGPGFGVIEVHYPPNGLQNGAPDGIALVHQSYGLLDFISYEGAMTATNGAAMGVESYDIKVSEEPSEIGQSLQLTGSGTNYESFIWTGPVDDTPGAFNQGQTLGTNLFADMTISGVTLNPRQPDTNQMFRIQCVLEPNATATITAPRALYGLNGGAMTNQTGLTPIVDNIYRTTLLPGLTNGTEFTYKIQVGFSGPGDNSPVTSALYSVVITDQSGALNIGGYYLIQTESDRSYTFPQDTLIAPSSYVIVAHNASRAEFEAFWNVDLDASTTYINSSDQMPLINGSETYTLRAANFSTILDGPTPTALNPKSDSVQRIDASLNATLESSWQKVGQTNATPGSGGSGLGYLGLVISEYSDAEQFKYEFIELFFDSDGAGFENKPPFLRFFPSELNVEVTVSNLVQFQVIAEQVAADIGDTTELFGLNIPSGAGWTDQTATAPFTNIFTWIPVQTGVYSLSFYAYDQTDALYSSTQTMTISVQSAPTHPTNSWDFEDGTFQGWASFSRASDANWENLGGGADDSSRTIFCNGYDADEASDDWFVSSRMNLAVYTQPRLSYWTRKLYEGPELEVLISTNYRSGDPLTNGAWTPLPYNPPPSDNTYYKQTNTLDAYAGLRDVFIAFHYLSSGTTNGSAARWSVDQISLYEYVPTNPELSITDPASANITVPYQVAAYSLEGSANVHVVGMLQWTNTLTDESGMEPAVTSWAIPNIRLNVGGNTITVYATNSIGVQVSDSVIINRQPMVNGILIAEADFNDNTLGDWVAYSETSSNDWHTYNHQGKQFARVTGYGGDEPAKDWLISPALQMQVFTSAFIRFETAMNYSDSGAHDFALLVSTNYTGSGNPTNADWTELTAPFSTGDWEWINSGQVDLSACLVSDVYLAFYYACSGTGSDRSETWEVDNIEVRGYADNFAEVRFSGSTGSIREAAAVLYTVTVHRASATGDASVQIAFSGSAEPADYNYAPSATNMQFTGSVTSRSLTVTINTDADSDDETVVMSLVNPVGAILTAPNRFTLTIMDPDTGPNDTDGDGIPDAWENRHNLGAALSNATEDADNDRQSNYEEYVADTNPTNQQHYLANTVTNFSVGGTTNTITFIIEPPTTNSRVYDVWWETNLIMQPTSWRAFGLDVPGDADGQTVALTVTNIGGLKFYRTGVKVP